MDNENPYQPTPTLPTAEAGVAPVRSRNWKDYSPEYDRAIRTALIIQAIMAVFTLLILDGGQLHRAFCVACLSQWAMVWILLYRRPMNPTRADLALVRYGIFAMFAVVAILGPMLLAGIAEIGMGTLTITR